MTDGFVDYYTTLGFEDRAHFDPSQLKSNYRQQAMAHHPDTSREPDAVERMQHINEAYGVLKNHELKQQYDWIYLAHQEAPQGGRFSEAVFHSFSTFRKTDSFKNAVAQTGLDIAKLRERINRYTAELRETTSRYPAELMREAEKNPFRLS